MGAKQAIFLFITILLSFQLVSALDIQSYKITSTPINGDYVDNIIELTIANDKSIKLTTGTLNFAVDAEILSIRDSYGNLQYVITEQADKQEVDFSFTTPIDSSETRVLTINTRTYNIVHKEGYFEYLLVIVPAKDINYFTHILKLSNDVNLNAESIIIPDAVIEETEEYILIEWNTDLKADNPTVFLTRFDQKQGINWWKWTAIVLISVILGIVLGITSNKLYIKYKQKKALKATNILNVREKAVLDHIIKNPSIKQYELVRALGYTKSNMSKILKRLEFRGLVKVKKYGKVRVLEVGDKLKRQL
ncbi:hypothetical protein COV16_05085 [Candidatus Woesearchaeota archaeon CG10_big_fil_rev_8_21_14_0_10_34_8]|nr:MAG: hypothetical protein COV16_05085 [Candidatus Woesearchaeota archaeon CG10_big_fil_rev_8_21_14_0_10_34_8]